MTDREKTIDGFAYWIENEENEVCYIPLNLCKKIMELLKEQEPKTGKWERHYSRPGVYADLFWWCSVCGEPTRYNDARIFYQYCPHCGAKLEPCAET